MASWPRSWLWRVPRSTLSGPPRYPPCETPRLLGPDRNHRRGCLPRRVVVDLSAPGAGGRWCGAGHPLHPGGQVMGFLANLFRAATPENPRFNLNDPMAWDTFLGGNTASSGVKVSGDTILTLPAFWRGVNLLARSVA